MPKQIRVGLSNSVGSGGTRKTKVKLTLTYSDGTQLRVTDIAPAVAPGATTWTNLSVEQKGLSRGTFLWEEGSVGHGLSFSHNPSDAWNAVVVVWTSAVVNGKLYEFANAGADDVALAADDGEALAKWKTQDLQENAQNTEE